MGALFVLLAMALLGVAAVQYWSVLDQVLPTVPTQFQDQPHGGLAIDIYIWNNNVPARARRQYLMCNVLGSIACALIAVGVFSFGDVVGGWCFAGVSALGAAWTAQRWIKYRELL